MRASTCPELGVVSTTWTLLAALRAAAASCSTSAADFFSKPLLVVPVAVVARPQPLAARAASETMTATAMNTPARRMIFIEIIVSV
jgi:hypothetical protein